MGRTEKIGLCLAMALLLSACQATPENPHVQAKDDGFLKQSATTAEKNTESTVKGEAWSGSFACKAYPVHTRIDVKMTIPERKYPICEISPTKMNQEQVDSFLSQFGEVEYHLNDDLRTQKDYQKEILSLQRSLANKDYEREARDQDEAEKIRQSYEEGISMYQRFMAEAPETAADVIEPIFTDEYYLQSILGGDILIDADGEIQKSENSDASWQERYERLKKNNFRSIRVRWDAAERSHTLDVFDSDVDMPGTSFFYNAGKGSVASVSYLPYEENLADMELKYEDALKLAQKQVDLLKMENMALAHCALGVDFKENAHYSNVHGKEFTPKKYIFWFTRNIEGTPVTFASNTMTYDRFDPPWEYESLRIEVGEEGVEVVSMPTLSQMTEQISDNAGLMPLNEIRRIAAEQFAIGNIALPEGIEKKNIMDMQLEINQAELGYTRIKLGDTSGRYVLVPAWDFFGEYVLDEKEMPRQYSYGTYDNLYRHSYLTINAVDGTIIDRSLGY